MGLASLNQGDGVLFGLDIPESVNVYLQAAALNPGDMVWAESNLKRALAENPAQLEVYVALYKLYCYRGRLQEAEASASRALELAAEQAGVEGDWCALTADSTDWSQFNGPARLLLYSLKALAFIRLRSGDYDSSLEILALLSRIDPSVVRDMAEGIRGDMDEGGAYA